MKKETLNFEIPINLPRVRSRVTGPKECMWACKDFCIVFSPHIQSNPKSINAPSSHLYLHSYYAHLSTQRLRQSSDLLVEKILGLLPHPGSSPVLQLEKAGQKSLAEHLGALAGQEGGEVVNTDHAKERALGAGGQGDRNCWLVECGSDRVDGDRIVGVGSGKC